jgi:hypothetical protein
MRDLPPLTFDIALEKQFAMKQILEIINTTNDVETLKSLSAALVKENSILKANIVNLVKGYSPF